MNLLEISDYIRLKLRRAKLGTTRPKSVRDKISRAMQGKSNFEGKTHTRGAIEKIKINRGHDDRIKGKHWNHSPKSGKENRDYKPPRGHVKGRVPAFKEWIKQKKED